MNIELLDAWMRGMKKAWEERDPQAAADLCSNDEFKYYESQFKEPLTTKAAVAQTWAEVPKDQSNVVFDFKIMATTKRGGVVHWWVSFDSKSARRNMTLDGVFSVKLDSKGLCSEFHQWWMAKK